MEELSLWLDGYDDIYSDFDPRGYSKRRISDDFLFELQQAFKYRKERFNKLLLLLPEERRDETAEQHITQRLKLFFSQQCQSWRENYRKKRRNGIIMLSAGILIMIINIRLSLIGTSSIPVSTIRVFMEPAGWFLLWTAMERLFYELREVRRQRDVFRELSGLSIGFGNTEK